MYRVLSIAHELSVELENMDCCKKYTQAKKIIENDQILMSEINIYKKNHYELQSKIVSNIQTSFEEEKYVSGLYSKLMLNSDVRDFLENEKNILRLLNEIYEIVGAVCPLYDDKES